MTKELIQDIIRWDVNSWTKALLFWEHKIDWNEIQNGLELGGREGGLSLWLALKGKQTICSDLKDVKNSAAKLHLQYKVDNLIEYRDIDATAIPYENHFDIIVFKSIIGGIGRNGGIDTQRRVFNEIYKALKPGGKLLFAENLAASPFHQRMRRKFVIWGDSWRYVSMDEMKEFLSDFSQIEIKSNGVLATFGRKENQRKMLYAIDNLILNRICPSSWKYISYGIAIK
jgi:SAM-dependent methyltransferase